MSSSSVNSDSATDAETLMGQKLYAQSCGACHGTVENSSKKGRSAESISAAINSIVQMSFLKGLSTEDVRLISIALAFKKTGTQIIGGRSYFLCDPKKVPITPSLKLSNREFKNSILGLLNDFDTALASDSQLNTLFNATPSDSIKSSRTTYKEGNSYNSLAISSSYFETSFRVGTLFSTSSKLTSYPNTASCLGAATLTQNCHQSFIKEFASRAFRKTLSATDANALATKLWDTSLSKVDQLNLSVTAILQMPEFMYRTYDSGQKSFRGDRVLNLTAEELAGKLSFFLTGKQPDATLKSLALSGQLLNKVTLEQQVDRLLDSSDARATILQFFRETYGYDLFDNFNYSSGFLEGLSNTTLRTEMTQELDSYFYDILITQKGSFKDLLTSQSSKIPGSQLAALYNVSSTGNVSLPANRSGFINRAGFLAKKSGNYTSPIRRGLFVLENVLCEHVGDPPPNAPTNISEEQILGQYQSTRERFSHAAEQPGSSCIFCHGRINTLGYNFEGFDSIGRTRSAEKIFLTSSGSPVATVPINTTSVVQDLSSTPITVSDSQDLAYKLSDNDKAIMCFAKSIKSFQSRVLASDDDGCSMNPILKVIYGSNGTQGSIRAAIKEFILSEDFQLWSY